MPPCVQQRWCAALRHRRRSLVVSAYAQRRWCGEIRHRRRCLVLPPCVRSVVGAANNVIAGVALTCQHVRGGVGVANYVVAGFALLCHLTLTFLVTPHLNILYT